jgi:uncharacterized protein YjiS (DUF1127 family)
MTAYWTPHGGTLSRLAGQRRAISWLLRHLDLLLLWQQRAAQRRRLAGLEDRLLADVGLSRAQALAEYRKPFWRA